MPWQLRVRRLGINWSKDAMGNSEFLSGGVCLQPQSPDWEVFPARSGSAAMVTAFDLVSN
jgi:hypothetical protein